MRLAKFEAQTTGAVGEFQLPKPELNLVQSTTILSSENVQSKMVGDFPDPCTLSLGSRTQSVMVDLSSSFGSFD